jgi:PAS domain S-box-containing protein
MNAPQPISILIVDDQPAKLLSITAALSPLGDHLVEASGANEALGVLLRHEIAVVLVDVCMPGTDGFELAELIRSHPRYGRTAIIFISAVQLSDEDRLRGYGLGAVDYIQVPLIPEVLRARVAVFTELYRKTRQLEQLNEDLERRVAERTREVEKSSAAIIDRERRYRELVMRLPVATYTCDSDGWITLFNDAAVELWGRRPELGKERWSGSRNLFTLEGQPLPVDQSSMASLFGTERHGRAQEIVVERSDGTRRIALPLPDTILDGEGRITGAVIMLLDVTDVHAAERDKRLLAAIVQSSDDAIISRGIDGAIISWNRGAERMFGYSAAEAIGQHISMLIPEDKREEDSLVYERLRSGEHVEHHETIRIARDGTRIDVSLSIAPLFDQGGRFIGFAKVARDIRDRKAAEALLARDKANLERLVRERTTELQLTHEQLRLADRMATIGTLSAGLGHDIGNLLLPVRMRLDAMERSSPTLELREDIDAIRQATDYLQRLSASLRLLSLDPNHEAPEAASTDLARWWLEAEGMIRNGIPRSVELIAEIDPTLPHGRIGKASITQVAFNLIQNAGHAVRTRQDGRVRITASHDADAGVLRMAVADNGTGMTDEIRLRCLEPFFTSKTREFGTGMGLSLVNGIIKRIGGTMAIESQPGSGTRIEFTIPTCARDRREPGVTNRGIAVVNLRDPRLQAHVRSTLESLNYEVRLGGPASDSGLWIGEANAPDAAEARIIAARNPAEKRVILFGPEGGPEDPCAAVITLPVSLRPSLIRAAIRANLAPRPIGAPA